MNKALIVVVLDAPHKVDIESLERVAQNVANSVRVPGGKVTWCVLTERDASLLHDDMLDLMTS